MKASNRFALTAFYVAVMLLTAFPFSWLLIEAAFYVHLRGIAQGHRLGGNQGLRHRAPPVGQRQPAGGVALDETADDHLQHGRVRDADQCVLGA